ncbi:MAG: hypothetical protein RXR39_05120 [Caldivirga sp.]
MLLVIGIDTLREGAPRTMGLNPEDYVSVPSRSHACWSWSRNVRMPFSTY